MLMHHWGFPSTQHILPIVNELYLCVLHPNLIEYTADTKSQNANTKCVYYNYAI